MCIDDKLCRQNAWHTRHMQGLSYALPILKVDSSTAAMQLNARFNAMTHCDIWQDTRRHKSWKSETSMMLHLGEERLVRKPSLKLGHRGHGSCQSRTL